MIGSGWADINIGVSVGILVETSVRVGFGCSFITTDFAVGKAWVVRALGLGVLVGFISGVRDGIGVDVEIFALGSCVAVVG